VAADYAVTMPAGIEVLETQLESLQDAIHP
jgi:hypothetical protein